jgi:alpha-amylase
MTKQKKLIQSYIGLLLLAILLPQFIAGCGSSEPNVKIDPPGDEIGNEWVVYEVYPGFYEKGKSFNAISNQLDNIKALGVNVLWLMPIYEEGVLKGIGSPYCIRDYKKVNSDYGTIDELKFLVSKAHDKGMKVIFDWVANHTSWDNAWTQNKDWYTQDSNGNIVSPPGMGWNDVADLNFNNNNMRKEMIAAMSYWINELNIDGYRCDYAEGVPDDFWEEAISELKKITGDDLLMLAEGGKASLLANGFDMLYAWDFAYRLQDLYAGKITVNNLYETHYQEYKDVPAGKQRMRYTTNHDMSSQQTPIQAYKGEKGAISAFVIATTLGGSPMIYSSQEVGYPTQLSFFNFINIDWNSNQSYKNEYKKIMDIYTSSDALKKGSLRTFENGKVATYVRKSQKETILILVNTANEQFEAKIPIEFSQENMINLLTNSVEKMPSVLTLEPYQYKILKI